MERRGERLVGFVYAGGESLGFGFVGCGVEVWMGARLKLEEFSFQSAEVDGKLAVRRGAFGHRVREEGVVGLGRRFRIFS